MRRLGCGIVSSVIRSALIWNLGGSALTRGSNLLFTFALARFISPEAFGSIAMIAICFAVGNALVESGLIHAIIRSREVTEADLSTVFYTNLVLGVTAYGGIYAVAPWIEAFYGQDGLTELLRVASLLVVINAPTCVQTALYSREMNFGPIVRANSLGALAAGSVAVTMAVYGFGVWSLVCQLLLGAFISGVLLWSRSDWRPGTQVDKGSFSRLFGFGYKLLIERILRIVYQNSYFVIIGKVFAPHLTGLFYFAARVNELLAHEVSAIIRKTTLPAMANFQDDDARLRRSYRRIVQTTLFVMAPLMMMIAVYSRPIVELSAGESWIEAAPFLSVLSLVGLLYPFHAINLNLLTVKGRSDLILSIGVVKKLVGFFLLLCALPFGVLIVACSQLVASILAVIPNTHYSKKLIDYGMREQSRDALLPLVFAAIAVGTSWVVGIAMGLDGPVARLSVAVAVASVSYLAMAIIADLPGGRLLFDQLTGRRAEAGGESDGSV